VGRHCHRRHASLHAVALTTITNAKMFFLLSCSPFHLQSQSQQDLPLHTVRECVEWRKERVGIDLVTDSVEKHHCTQFVLTCSFTAATCWAGVDGRRTRSHTPLSSNRPGGGQSRFEKSRRGALPSWFQIPCDCVTRSLARRLAHRSMNRKVFLFIVFSFF
jgi:hypothetical protein